LLLPALLSLDPLRVSGRPFWVDACLAFVIILVRYLLVAGISGWLLNLVAVPPGEQQQQGFAHDLALSVGSAVIFALTTALILQWDGAGGTRLYGDPGHYGLWYLGFSYVLVLLLQDTSFYVTHRLFHLPFFYRWCHLGHHRSKQPTPWTSFAFDPIEAVTQGLFLIAIVLLVPLHYITLLAVLTTMSIWAVVNHLGLERLPAKFPHHWLGRWLIGPAHHGLHHQRQSLHFGLYFTFWDRVCGTEAPSYPGLSWPAPPRPNPSP
jgi:sterol desaturase/sphingolipid hydroxylase (fatty acid hydroxylase superfamily)